MIPNISSQVKLKFHGDTNSIGLMFLIDFCSKCYICYILYWMETIIKKKPCISATQSHYVLEHNAPLKAKYLVVSCLSSIKCIIQSVT